MYRLASCSHSYFPAFYGAQHLHYHEKICLGTPHYFCTGAPRASSDRFVVDTSGSTRDRASANRLTDSSISLPSQSGSNLRGRFLHRAGYSIFLFDFQAHGESPRWRVTFGARESLNAHAAATYLCRQVQGEKVGAIGASLGGAAAPKGERAAILLAGFGRHRVRVPAGDRQGAVLWEIPPEGPLRTKVPLGAKFRGTVEQPIVRSVSKLQGNDPRLFSEDH